MDARIEKLDEKMDRIIEVVRDFGLKAAERMHTIETRLSVIETKLDTKLAKTDLIPLEKQVSDIGGAVKSIPNVWQTLAIMAGLLVGVSGLAFTLAKWAQP